MSKEGTYLVFCLERYRHARGLSGRDAAALFRKYNLYDYVMRFFPAFHTMSETLVFEDIDAHISRAKGSV